MVKNLWVEIDAEMAMMIELADKDIKTIFNVNCAPCAQKDKDWEC